MTKAIPNHPHPGKGQYRAAWTRCVNGHPALEPDPRDKRGILRMCRQCARVRAQAQYDAIAAAAACLSLPIRAYKRTYGQSTDKALEILSRCEAEAVSA